MRTEPVIWVLGENVPNADKSISWDSPFPNFSDPDILIINLQTLTKDVLRHIDKTEYSQAKDTIHDKFLNGGTIIFITAPYYEISDQFIYSNYDLAPVHFATQKVQEGYKINYEKKYNEYAPYIEEVGKFDFYLNGIQHAHQIAYKIGADESQLKFQTMPRYDIKDNAGHTLGCSLSLPPHDGIAIFLPPATKVSISEAIGKILEVHGKTGHTEIIPSWISNISLPNIKEKDAKINELQLQKQQIQHQMEQLQHEKQIIMNHCRLLYSKGTPLEDAVAEAFKILGFNEIKKVRNMNDEDWVFEFKTLSNYKYGIIEVKGADARTLQQNLTQCSKWVDEHFELDKKVSKGIFIPNQHRLSEYPKSKKDREHFETNELSYAKMKSICIIPSCILFEAVKKALEGKIKSRKEIEKLIAETNGVLSEI
jgi:hypothetical protein